MQLSTPIDTLDWTQARGDAANSTPASMPPSDGVLFEPWPSQSRYPGMKTSQVTCKCGALYERTEFHAAPREADSFVCPACGHTLEVFTAADAPRYRLISGPPPEPESPFD